MNVGFPKNVRTQILRPSLRFAHGVMLLALISALLLSALSPTLAEDDPSTTPARRQIKRERIIGHAYKRGVRIPGDITLAERTWTRDGHLSYAALLTSNDPGTLSDEKTSSLATFIHARASKTVTSYTYDERGRLSEESMSAYGSRYSTVYTYDPTHQRSGAVHYEAGRVTGNRVCALDLHDSVISECEFDKTNQPLTADSVTFDTEHRRVGETHLTFGDGGRLISQSARSYTYDDRSRLTGQFEESAGNLIGTKRYVYNGQESKPAALIAGECSSAFVYDDHGQLIQEKVSYSGATRGYRQFEYDVEGNLVRETSYNAKEELVDEMLHQIEYWQQ
jgi:YD repeat-containing protein